MVLKHNQVPLMNRACSPLLLIALAYPVLASCGSVSPNLVLPSRHRYELTRFIRKNPTQPPIICGYVDQREPTGTYHMKRSMITVNGQPIFSDSTGRYGGEVPTGSPLIVAKWIGYESIPVERLRVKRGDSLRIDFHLQGDKVPLNLQINRHPNP